MIKLECDNEINEPDVDSSGLFALGGEDDDEFTVPLLCCVVVVVVETVCGRPDV